MVGSYSNTLYLFLYKKTGHPMTILAGAFNQLGWIIMGFVLRTKWKNYMVYASIPFVFLHASTSLCVYKEWLPSTWVNHPKQNFEMQLLWSFINAGVLPT